MNETHDCRANDFFQNANGVSQYSPGLPRSGYPGVWGMEKNISSNTERVVPISVFLFSIHLEIRRNPFGVECVRICVPQGSRFAATLG